MKLVSTIAQLREQTAVWKSRGLSIGLVPTMGFLHEGHQSLMRAAAEDNDKVVVSIFVNPTQFAPGEDLERYPRDLAHDEHLCRENGVDLILHPSAEEMYPAPFHTGVQVAVLSEGLCGRSRPTHFGGVCTVVAKLFNIVQPDRAYFGQKDAQQLAVIRQMVNDLNFPVAVVGCPIVREADGLAKSSRNAYLNDQERVAALAVPRSLVAAKEALNRGERSARALGAIVTEVLNAEPQARIDYVSVVDAASLQPLEVLDRPALIAVAVFFGKTRLIDNLTVDFA